MFGGIGCLSRRILFSDTLSGKRHRIVLWEHMLSPQPLRFDMDVQSASPDLLRHDGADRAMPWGLERKVEPEPDRARPQRGDLRPIDDERSIPSG